MDHTKKWADSASRGPFIEQFLNKTMNPTVVPGTTLRVSTRYFFKLLLARVSSNKKGIMNRKRGKGGGSKIFLKSLIIFFADFEHFVCYV